MYNGNFKISNNINEAINNKIIISELSKDNRIYILNLIRELYIDTRKKSIWLWERLNEYESLQDSKGWSYIQYYIDDNSCILFFNQDEDDKMFRVSNGTDLQFILSETYGFEFYVTDINCSFLLCFNHHDILYACGNAIEWIKKIKLQK